MTPVQTQAADAGSDPRLDMLRACRGALGREAHTLTARPDLLWQQLYNRLQWEDGPVPGLLEPQLRRRSAPGVSPWLRTRTRSLESEALRHTLTGHTDGVLTCAISPDSDFVVTASWDNTCKIWDAATGRERLTLRGHTAHVLACAISPDSSYIVTASNDHTSRIWDAATGGEQATLTGHTDKVLTCAISPDSSYIVTASSDKTCKLWDAATGRQRATLLGHKKDVYACAISPDSTYIVTASWDKTARIWDVATGRVRATLIGHKTVWANACVISPDSSYIVTASDDRTARIWETATGRERATITGHTDQVHACAISPDSDFVVTASWDKTCKIWDAATGRERATLSGHTDRVRACTISPDSSYIVTASRDRTARIWDAATGRERASLPSPGDCNCAAVHPWRPFAVCGDKGGNVYLMDLVGIQYGPIVVTAVELGKSSGTIIRCPKCLQLHPLNDAWLGQVVACPTLDCGLSLRVNPFITRVGNRHTPDRGPQLGGAIPKQEPGKWWSRKR